MRGDVALALGAIFALGATALVATRTGPGAAVSLAVLVVLGVRAAATRHVALRARRRLDAALVVALAAGAVVIGEQLFHALRP